MSYSLLPTISAESEVECRLPRPKILRRWSNILPRRRAHLRTARSQSYPRTSPLISRSDKSHFRRSRCQDGECLVRCHRRQLRQESEEDALHRFLSYDRCQGERCCYSRCESACSLSPSPSDSVADNDKAGNEGTWLKENMPYFKSQAYEHDDEEFKKMIEEVNQREDLKALLS